MTGIPFPPDNAAQTIAYLAIVLGTTVSLAGIFITRYYAKRPVNGEHKTLHRNDVKIKQIKGIIDPIKKNISRTNQQWKTHH